MSDGKIRIPTEIEARINAAQMSMLPMKFKWGKESKTAPPKNILEIFWHRAFLLPKVFAPSTWTPLKKVDAISRRKRIIKPGLYMTGQKSARVLYVMNLSTAGSKIFPLLLTWPVSLASAPSKRSKTITVVTSKKANAPTSCHQMPRRWATSCMKSHRNQPGTKNINRPMVI